MVLRLVPHCKANIFPVPARGNGKNGGGGQNPVDQMQKQEVTLMKNLAVPLMSAIVALSPIINPPVGEAMDVQKGSSLFNRTCMGCHDGGGNIIVPGATLFLKDLQRNGVDTEEEIYRVTYNGKGRMPGFGVNCTPRGQCTFGPRLQDDEIKLLAEFVKSKADQGGSGFAAAVAAVGGVTGLDFGVDPNMDPELALALRLSMEEERARHEATAKKAAEEASKNEKGEGSTSQDATMTDNVSVVAPAKENRADDVMDDENALLQQALAMSMDDPAVRHDTYMSEAAADDQDFALDVRNQCVGNSWGVFGKSLQQTPPLNGQGYLEPFSYLSAMPNNKRFSFGRPHGIL